MNIHEYQAKQVLKKFGVPVSNGEMIEDLAELDSALEKLNGWPLVVKAQIHAGGRGKAGGVKLSKNLEEVKANATDILGKTLITHQTGPEGKVVGKLYIEEGCNIAQEFYFSILVDRATGRVALMASQEGGVVIEEVAAKDPDAILTLTVDPASGLSPFQARRLAFALDLPNEAISSASKLFMNSYKAFMATDASLLEVNPFVLTKDNTVIALDAKMGFDDNALFKHPDIAELRDPSEEDAKETEAKKYDLSYVSMEGEIGCLVNGAGLAMATMDIIKFYGKEPANFLDVGGGANAEKVTAAFKIILADPNVKGILVNIFGGIMKCDVIAEGVIAAAKEVGITVPLVVRLEGTNVELGKKILDESDLTIISADTMADAAEKVCESISGGAA